MTNSEDLLRIKIASSALDNSSDMSCISLCYLLGKAKVTDLGIHLHVQKDITALYIAVYDSWIAPIV